MTDLIALAKQADAVTYTNRHYLNRTSVCFNPDTLQAFADLILKEEREACAVVCDELAELNRTSPTNSMWQWAECAAAIRARGAT